ncbi:unnamed protein product, partial [marine sediment metagenome]
MSKKEKSTDDRITPESETPVETPPKKEKTPPKIKEES